MENSLPLFQVPIISPELSQEEMIMQIADSLDYLSSVVTTLFDCIQTGISLQHARIADINSRADVAKAKIEKLTGSKSATTVYSSAKYPASDAYREYTSIFANARKLPPPVREEITRSSKKDSIDSTMREKLQFFHIRSKVKMLKRNVDIVPKDGLGPLPSNIESVSSLLLFNTAECPYKNYVSMDPMKVAARTKSQERDDKRLLDDAPESIALGEQLAAQMEESFLYSPSLGEVPLLDLPLDLPDLPGVADNLRYSFDVGPGFAPSVASTPSLPELPKIPEIDPAVPPPPTHPSSPLVTKAPSDPITHVPPPPPPPPPPPAEPALVESSPPPPPPFANLKYTPEITSKSQAKPASSDDARSSLMDAIRKAGGSSNARLKSVRENQDELRRKREEKAIAAGGDLMADLHSRLLMRRKGISGDKSATGSAMDRISAMIPPPPAQQDTSSATEDDEWDSDS